MSKRIIKSIYLVALLFIFSQFWKCERNITGASPELPLSFLMAAPDTVIIKNQKLVLRTSLWRDFMPVSPPGGKGLTALVYIETADSSAISDSIDCDNIYVINEKDVWRSHFSDDSPPFSDHVPYRLAKIARDGPQWGPKIYVAVVVRLIFKKEIFYLLAADQYIGATF